MAGIKFMMAMGALFAWVFMFSFKHKTCVNTAPFCFFLKWKRVQTVQTYLKGVITTIMLVSDFVLAEKRIGIPRS